MAIPKVYIGKWRITEMEQWDRDYIDMVVPGHFTFAKDGSGSFQFGVVEGELDCRLDRAGDQEVLAFTWEGSDECDPASGRGWVAADGKQMIGHLFFHEGDDSGFKAKKGL